MLASTRSDYVAGEFLRTLQPQNLLDFVLAVHMDAEAAYDCTLNTLDKIELELKRVQIQTWCGTLAVVAHKLGYIQTLQGDAYCSLLASHDEAERKYRDARSLWKKSLESLKTTIAVLNSYGRSDLIPSLVQIVQDAEPGSGEDCITVDNVADDV